MSIYSSSPALRAMIKSISNGRILTPSEESSCILLAKKGCAKSKKLLVDANMRLVLKRALTYKGIGSLEIPDLVNSGAIGLIESIDSYDQSYNVRFTTYASNNIRASMIDYVRSHSSTVRLPSNQRELMLKKIKEAKEKEIEVSDEIKELISNCSTPKSFDSPISTDNNSSTYGESLASDSNTGESAEMSARTTAIQQALSYLDPKESKILKMLHGFDEYVYTLQEVAEHYGLSIEGIRQIREKGLNNMRRMKKELKELV